MKKMAHIKDGKVVNVSLWDGQSEWTPSDEVVEIPSKTYINPRTGETFYIPLAGIGWDYIDGQFIDNRPVEDEFGNIVEPNQPKEEETTEGES